MDVLGQPVKATRISDVGSESLVTYGARAQYDPTPQATGAGMT